MADSIFFFAHKTMTNNLKLTFGKGNAKLNKTIITFSLPAGKTCPFAKDCKAQVKEINGHLKLFTFKDTKFRCFAASNEALFPNVFRSREYNLKLLKLAKSSQKMTTLIKNSLPKKFDKCRIHVSGDFFSEEYLKAWINVAKDMPDKLFYAYTKSVKYIVNQKDNIPNNLVITCSLGGKDDDLIIKNNLKRVKVYFHPDFAKADGVEIDHDDSLAINPNIKEFGLLLHGSQPKNSDASKALSKMKQEHIHYGYSRSN